MPILEEPEGTCKALPPTAVLCASFDKWLPPGPGEKAAPPPPDRRMVAAALDAVLRVADAARQAADDGLELRVEDRPTEGRGREVRILILPRRFEAE